MQIILVLNIIKGNDLQMLLRRIRRCAVLLPFHWSATSRDLSFIWKAMRSSCLSIMALEENESCESTLIISSSQRALIRSKDSPIQDHHEVEVAPKTGSPSMKILNVPSEASCV